MALASSSSSATVAVEKATSDLLIGPDWSMNIDICDSVNSNHWLVKDVVKAVKKRLQHKNPKVQLLALTLLETMVKNCGDHLHFQIAEKNILGEMVRIVKKKTDMHVRDKILVLLDSWQEAFGGPGGKHPQYYWAYEELRRSGVEFPQRSLDAAPIFTPPVAHSTMRHVQAGYGMPSTSSRRLDETMATEIEGLSLSSIESMRNVMELLNDMLQAVNPDDCKAVKDEIIVDLVNQCRSNQKKLMQMLTTTGDEELLVQGLELNDSLQILLAKHDAIATGSPMPTQNTNLEPKLLSSTKPTEVKDSGPSSSTNTSASVVNIAKSYIDEEDEEEDDFAQLARRHSKPQSNPPQSSYETSQALVPADVTNATSFTVTTSTPPPCNALALIDPPAPVRTTKEQDIIDLLSITLSTSTSEQPPTPHTPPTSNQSIPQAPASSAQGYPYISQTYPENQGQAVYNNYVAPWAQPLPQSQSQIPHPHVQSQLQQQDLHQPQQQFLHQPNPQSHILPQSQFLQQFQTQPQQHAQPQPQQQFETQSQPQHDAQPQPQPQQQFETQPQPQQHAQPQPQPQPQQQFQPQSQTQSYAQPLQQFQPQSQAYAEPQSQQQFQPQFQPRLHSQPQQQFPQPQPQPQQLPLPQPQHQQQFQPRSQNQFQPQLQSQYTQYTSRYPPPPWAATPGYANGQSHMSTANNMYSTTQANTASSYTPAQAARPLHHYNSFPSRGTNGSAMNGDPIVSSAPAGQKPFVPSYRLFEDLNVFGNTDGRFKITGSMSPSLSGASSQGMVGGRK